MTMVLGADPDAKAKDWPDDPTPRQFQGRVSPPIRRLLDHFCYHRGMTMSMRCDDQDKSILGRYFAKKTSQGFTEASLVRLVDRFWQSWGSEYDKPALAFVSSKMQDKLIHEAEVVKDDPILTWMLDGMPDRGPFEDSREMRKAVLLAGDCVNRYPDVVASVLAVEGTLEATRERLNLLDTLVATKLSRGSLSYASSLARHLPDELQGPGSLRPLQPTLQLAIANIPRRKHDEV